MFNYSKTDTFNENEEGWKPINNYIHTPTPEEGNLSCI